jgi:CDP-diacylglycerol--serine O-phosphatidyltransferase
LEGFDKSHFTGLPSPVAAGTLASYIIFNEHLFPGTVWPNSLLVLTFIVSILMVSRIRYEVVPNFSFRGDKKQKILLSVLIISIIVLVAFPKQLLFPYSVIYILSGMIRFLYRLAMRKGISR